MFKDKRAALFVFQNMKYGALFLDSDLRARLGNRAYRELWGIPQELLERVPGPTVRELIDFNRDSDLYDTGDLNWDEYVAARIEAVRIGPVPATEMRR